MLNKCPEAVRNGRYTWRHDSILFTICHYLNVLENIGFKLFADLAGFKNPEILFNGPRPDIVVKNGNKLTVIELSHCYKTNFVKTRNYKIILNYKICDKNRIKTSKVTKLYVEVSSLGFLPKNMKEFRNLCKQYDYIHVMKMMEKLSEVAIRSCYFIYTRRNY